MILKITVHRTGLKQDLLFNSFFKACFCCRIKKCSNNFRTIICCGSEKPLDFLFVKLLRSSIINQLLIINFLLFRFQYILEQYDIREKQIEKINHQLDLNNQLNDAKMAKLQMEKSVEKEMMLREKGDLLVELEKCKKLIVDLSTKEQLLREQLMVYSEKYQDFQSSIQKSNNVFVGYKTEIEKASCSIIIIFITTLI